MLYRCFLLVFFVLFTVNIYAQTIREELDEFENSTFDLANNIVETTLDDVSVNINRNINRNWEVGSAISNISGDLSGVLNTGITTAGSVINTGITTTGEVINTAIVTLPDVLNTIMNLLVSSQEQLHELERRIGEDIDYLFDTSILRIAREAIATRFGTLAFGGIRSSVQALVGDVSGGVSDNDLTNEDIVTMYNMDSNKDGEISIREMRKAVRKDRRNLPIIQRVFNIVTRSDMREARRDRRDYNSGNINDSNSNSYVYHPTEDGYFSNRTDSNTRENTTGGNDNTNITGNNNINSGNNSSIGSGISNTSGSINENINNNNDSNSNTNSSIGNNNSNVGSSSNNLGIGSIVGNNSTNTENGVESNSTNDDIITFDEVGISIAANALKEMVGEKQEEDCNKVIHDFIVTCADRLGYDNIVALENQGNLTVDTLYADMIPGYNPEILYMEGVEMRERYNVPESIVRILFNRPSTPKMYLLTNEGALEEYPENLRNNTCTQENLPKVCYVNNNDKTDVTILYFGEGKEYCGENRKNDGIITIDYTCDNFNIY